MGLINRQTEEEEAEEEALRRNEPRLSFGCSWALAVLLVVILAACGYAEVVNEPPTPTPIPTVVIDPWSCDQCWGLDSDMQPVCMNVGMCRTEGCCE